MQMVFVQKKIILAQANNLLCELFTSNRCLTLLIIIMFYLKNILYRSLKTCSKTEEREALRKQGLNEKTTASVLLKLFISGNKRCHTTDAP